jgi:hypothetical protein
MMNRSESRCAPGGCAPANCQTAKLPEVLCLNNSERTLRNVTREGLLPANIFKFIPLREDGQAKETARLGSLAV